MTGKPSPKRTEDRKAPVTYSPYLMRRHHEQVADWLQANGVDPDVVAIDHPISVVDGVIHYHVTDLDDAGQQAEDVEAVAPAAVARTARCVEPAPNLPMRGAEAR